VFAVAVLTVSLGLFGWSRLQPNNAPKKLNPEYWGASINQVLFLLSGEFYVGLLAFIAIPFTWWAMPIAEHFAYRIQIS
jgi:hypothetical protein